MWLFPQCTMAEDVQKLVISKNDGTEVSFLLRDKPIITFGDGVYSEMNIKTANHEIGLSTHDLDKMTIISADASNITNIKSKKETMFSWKGDALYIEVLTGNATIVVYDMGGKMILSKSLGVGKHALSLSEFPKGMCVIKVNDETLKIRNR